MPDSSTDASPGSRAFRIAPDSTIPSSTLTISEPPAVAPPSAEGLSAADNDGPGPVWLALGFVLAGVGTVMLGPLLPWLSKAWHLSDAQGGILLALKFSGAFLGGLSVLRRLRFGILLGAALCCTGFGLFSLTTSLPAGGLALFVAGLGLGQLIASTNILVGRRYAHGRGSALALVNLFWSLGAVTTGLLVALLLPRFGLRGPLLSFAALFLVTGAGGAYSSRRSLRGSPQEAAPTAPALRLTPKEFLYFAALLFLYGGLETALSGWLTTYSLRFADTQWLGGQAAVVLMWLALTAGRGLTSLLMRTQPEARVRNVGLSLTMLAILGLLSTTHASLQLGWCLLVGLGLAPFFPASFARLMLHEPTARVAGIILAVSGLGASLFPWMVGVISAATGSLRLALLVPFVLTGILLALGFVEPRPRVTHPSG